MMCEIEGPHVLNERTARHYLQKFENGQTSLRKQDVLVDQRFLAIVV